MKKNNKNSIITALILMLGFIGPAAALAAGPAPVDLLSVSTNSFAILSKTGITDTGSHSSAIIGNIGSSPITAAAMNGVFCSEMAGTVYGVDAAYTGSGAVTCFAGNPPSSNKTLVDNAILDIGTAYTNAAGRTGPDGVDLYGADLGGKTFAPGLYKWNSNVTIPTDVTLSGGANDVWIFQISGDLSIAGAGSVPSGTKVILSGGAQASNVFWQVGGGTGATLGTYSTFSGTILSATQVIIQTGAVLNGRALAQTQVTLDAAVVTVPVPTVPVVGGPVFIDTNLNGILDSGELYFNTISAAIAAASAGNTIRVTAGTYIEQVTINKNLTLIGAGTGTTIIQAPASLVNDSLGKKVIVETSNSAIVTMSGFTIRGPGSLTCASIDYGVFVVGNSSLHIHDSAITNIEDTPLGDCQNGSGIQAGSQALSQIGSLTVTNTTISNYQKTGVVIDNIGSTGTITNNIITGVGPTPVIAQNGIQISRGATGVVSGNTISGNVYTGGAGACAGDGSTANKVTYAATCTMSDGIFLFQQGSGITISGNTISANQIGVALSGGSTAAVTLNTIINNAVYGLNTDVITDASGNYWGAATSPVANGSLPGSTIATFSPWYTDAGMTTLAFTPAAPGTLHVIKLVVNSNSGASIPSDFSVTIKLAGANVIGSPAAGTSTPGTLYSLPAGTYVISENTNTSYTQSFSGACDSNGSVTLLAGDDKICTIIDTDFALPVVPAPVSSSSGNNNAANFTAPLPLINVTKIPAPLALPSGPGSVTYTYVATNVGIVAMSGVWVRDDLCGAVSFVSGDTNNDAKLDLHEAWIYRCTKTVSKTETNTVTAHGQANGWDGYDVAVATVIVGATPGFPNTGLPAPLIKIVTVPDRLTPFPIGGGDITYSYTVTNPGVVAVSNVVVNDDKCGPVSGPFSGDANGDKLLNPGEAWKYSCRTHIPASTMDVVTAMAKGNGFVALDYAFTDVLVVATPGLPNTGLPQTAIFRRSLSMGAQGADVTALQTILTQKGFLTMPPGVAKGYFGAFTRAAIIRYQTSVGLPPVGVLGPLTRARLNAVNP